MSLESLNPLRLTVLNPSGRDLDQTFPDGAGLPNPAIHPPVNYHAYAACTSGAFLRSAAKVPQGLVILLLRKNLKEAASVLRALKQESSVVWVALKEAGTHQVASLLADPARLRLFRELCQESHGALASTPELVSFFLGAGASRAKFLPTPYPVEDPRWDFSQPLESRRGILVGTREFDVPSRAHLPALLALLPLACRLGVAVSVVNVGGRTDDRLLRSLGYPESLLHIHPGRRPYPDYLRLVAQHRIVFQLDTSLVPGQVAGDCLLSRTPCIGGNGAIERLAYPKMSGAGTVELLSVAEKLLTDDARWHQEVASAQTLATTSLSFSTLHTKLRTLL